MSRTTVSLPTSRRGECKGKGSITETRENQKQDSQVLTRVHSTPTCSSQPPYFPNHVLFSTPAPTGMSTTPYTTDYYKAEDHHLIMHRTWCVVKATAPFTALPPLIRGSSRESVFSPPSSRRSAFRYIHTVLAWVTAVD